MKNILINIVLIIFFTLVFNFSYAQKLNTIYVGFSSDSLLGRNLLEFKNDSMLEFRAYPQHMNFGFYSVTMKYRKENDTIHIKKSNIQPQDSSLGIIIPPPSYFLDNDIILKIDDNAIIDKKDNRVYIEQNDIEKNKNNIVVAFNGKLYTQGTKEARKLMTQEVNLEENIENYKITIYRGLEAYLKYGYDAVLGGVIEIEEKEN